jgi:hypothetical protein
VIAPVDSVIVPQANALKSMTSPLVAPRTASRSVPPLLSSRQLVTAGGTAHAEGARTAKIAVTLATSGLRRG